MGPEGSSLFAITQSAIFLNFFLFCKCLYVLKKWLFFYNIYIRAHKISLYTLAVFVITLGHIHVINNTR